jgi:hypothetical protein
MWAKIVEQAKAAGMEPAAYFDSIVAEMNGDGAGPGTCSICGKEARARCHDLVCVPCHKTESFWDCLKDKQVNSIRREASLDDLTAVQTFEPMEKEMIDDDGNVIEDPVEIKIKWKLEF